jgi:hypothetical protein
MTVAPPDRPASEPTLSVTRGEFVLIDALAVTVLLAKPVASGSRLSR